MGRTGWVQGGVLPVVKRCVCIAGAPSGMQITPEQIKAAVAEVIKANEAKLKEERWGQTQACDEWLTSTWNGCSGWMF